MRIGDLQFDFLIDGSMRIDGGAYFGVVPRALWERGTPPDERNRVTLDINCPLIRAGGKNIVVDTGLGLKHTEKLQKQFVMQAGRLVDELRGHGLEPAVGARGNADRRSRLELHAVADVAGRHRARDPGPRLAAADDRTARGVRGGHPGHRIERHPVRDPRRARARDRLRREPPRGVGGRPAHGVHLG